MSLDIKRSFETRAIHSHYNAQDHLGSLASPIYQTSTYVFKSVEEGAAISTKRMFGLAGDSKNIMRVFFVMA